MNVRDGVTRVKDRLLYVLLRDRSARGANAQNVPLGKGVANLREFFAELERQDDRQISTRLGGDGSPVVTTRVPIAMTIDTTGDRQGARRYLRGGVGVRGCRAACVCRELHRVLAHAANPLRRRHAVARRDARAGRHRAARRRDAGEDRRRDSEQADCGAEKSSQAACHREPRRHVAQHHSAHQRDDPADGREDRRVDDGVQQRSQQPAISEGEGIRRDLPEQHRRRVPAGSGHARGPRALCERRGRHRRHSRHAVGLAQLGRVRRDDRRAERAAPHRERHPEGVRQGQSDRAAVQLRRPAVPRGVPTGSRTRATAGCAGTRCACC